jgi:hypothetical protein
MRISYRLVVSVSSPEELYFADEIRARDERLDPGGALRTVGMTVTDGNRTYTFG